MWVSVGAAGIIQSRLFAVNTGSRESNNSCLTPLASSFRPEGGAEAPAEASRPNSRINRTRLLQRAGWTSEEAWDDRKLRKTWRPKTFRTDSGNRLDCRLQSETGVERSCTVEARWTQRKQVEC